MTVESASFLSQLNLALPDPNDGKSEGDDHLRLLKSVLQGTFPNFAGRFRRFQSKSGNYTLVPNDNGSIIAFTGGSTLSGDAASAAATLGNGWHVLVFANGVDVTIDPNGAETVNGATTLLVPNGQAGLLSCDGTAFYFWILLPFLEISGVLSKSVAGAVDVTLTAPEARNPILVLSGVLTGNINVILPTTRRTWVVYNNTTGAFTLTVKTAAGTGILLPRNVWGLLVGDGTNMLSQLESSQPTVLNPSNVSQALADAGTVTWDMNLGGIASVTLAGNRTLGAPTNLKVGTYILHVLQDGAGSRTLAYNGVYKWSVGTPPVLSTGAGKRDILTFVSDGVSLYGSILLDVR